jgi:hypothetical protein
VRKEKTMRKALIAAVVLMVLIIAGEMFWAALRWRGQHNLPTEKHSPPTAAGREERILPALPNISLQINADHELTEFQGTPLILSVRLANQRAINAELANQAERIQANSLEDKVARRELRRDQVAPQLASLRAQHKAGAVLLGNENAGWEEYVHFSQLRPEGKQQALPWRLKLAATPASKTVTLDAANTAQLDYLLSPNDAGQIAPGDYEILAYVEVPADAGVRADRCEDARSLIR